MKRTRPVLCSDSNVLRCLETAEWYNEPKGIKRCWEVKQRQTLSCLIAVLSA